VLRNPMGQSGLRGLGFAGTVFVVLFLAFGPWKTLAADDRHAGYYYPPVAEPEVYPARVATIPQANRRMRVAFVTGISNENRKRPHPPVFVMFAKGEESQKLIIVALQDGFFDTIFRARAFFADLTAVARLLPVFRELGVEEHLTFFDLANMMGFEQITISNGRDFSHQVMLR